MSTTFTLPVSMSDHFDHGHARSHSHRRPTGSRLSPPFSLPRIPSESIVQRLESHEHHNHSHEHHTHSHEHHAHGHDQEHKRDGSNTNEDSFRANSLIQTPSPEFLDPVSKRRTLNPLNMSGVTIGRPQHARPRIVSRPTSYLLQSTENYSLLHGILADAESRRIFYFMLLNLAFMVVQSTYGFLTGSLGLISDSIHMFFDCVALLVGLCAAVMSKWPPSVKFPYGYGKVDTLAGLGNGIFLMLISVEIVYEAMERLSAGADLSRTTELLIVSTLGLIVNLVGISAFHGHHGHDHGHGHSHSHAHGHNHDHGHHDHDHDHPSARSDDSSALMSASASPMIKSQKAGHGGHGHSSENMQGIYLHIMADALGSVAVVISTILVQLTGWNGFDPLASCAIAILIFISTVPLVISTTKNLLLSLNSDVEYNLREILGEVSAIRGVASYTVPKFWLEDIKKEDAHGHHHGHSHDHGHSHHDSASSLSSACGSEDPMVLGVIHIIALPNADLHDVKERVSAYLSSRKMDIVVQVEREGEGRCWCGGGVKTS